MNRDACSIAPNQVTAGENGVVCGRRVITRMITRTATATATQLPPPNRPPLSLGARGGGEAQ